MPTKKQVKMDSVKKSEKPGTVTVKSAKAATATRSGNRTGLAPAIRQLVSENLTDDAIVEQLRSNGFPKAVRSNVIWVRNHALTRGAGE